MPLSTNILIASNNLKQIIIELKWHIYDEYVSWNEVDNKDN